MEYEVRLIDDAGICIKTFTAHSKCAAERVEDGLNINLNHEEYYTEIVEIQDES